MLGKSGEEDESGKEASGLQSRHWRKPKPCLIAYFGSWENVSWRILFRNFKDSFVERGQEVNCSHRWRREMQAEPQRAEDFSAWHSEGLCRARRQMWTRVPGDHGVDADSLPLSLQGEHSASCEGRTLDRRCQGGTTPALECSSPDTLWCWRAEYCELEDGLQAVKCERCLLLWMSRWHKWVTLYY